jgi:hypothetical protein
VVHIGVVASLPLGAALAAAMIGWARHARRSRVAAYVERAGDAMREGTALLYGRVGGLEPDEAALALEVPAEGTSSALWRASARPFELTLPSGASVRVEPEEGQWSLDTTFVPTSDWGSAVYATEIRAGASVYVYGTLRREIDARSAGLGYRDAARAWVVRAAPREGLRVSTEDVIARHAARARFHARWARRLGAAGAALGAFTAITWARPVGAVAVLLVLVLVPALLYAYWEAAEDSAPWLERDVTSPRR